MNDPYSDDRVGNPYAYYEVIQSPEEKIPQQEPRIADFPLTGYLVFMNFFAMPIFFVFLAVIVGRIQHPGIRFGNEIGLWPLFRKLFLSGFYFAPLILFLIYAILHFLHWHRHRDKRFFRIGWMYLIFWLLFLLGDFVPLE